MLFIKYQLCLNREKTKQIRMFFRSLLSWLPDIYCWASSCSTENTPKDWRSEILTVPISCPPSVLQEMAKENPIPGVVPYSESKFTSPTEGMPVMHIKHSYSSAKHIDYEQCGKNILNVLSQALRISCMGTIYLCFDEI